MTEDTRPGALRAIGKTEDGRIRLRGGWGFEEYRQLGLNLGDLSLLPPITSAQGESTRNRRRALAVGRDVERNNETIRGGLDRKANTVVGPSLRPNPQPDIVWLRQTPEWMLEYRQAAASVFTEWATDLFCRNDAEGHYQFGGLMWQGFRGLAGPDAEVGGYIGYDRDRADELGTKWATYVHLVDIDRISTPDGFQEGENRLKDSQPIIYEGRQVDRLGAMRGIHISTRHPADSAPERIEWDYVPRWTEHGRPMAFHWFFKRRAGLQRAITTLSAVLSTVEGLGKWSQARLTTAISHSLMAAYLKTTMQPDQAAAHMAPRSNNGEDEQGNPLSEYDLKVDAYDKLGLKFGGKRVAILGPNDELKFESLAGTAMDFDPFNNAFLRELASALGISFEQLSLNFALASYSSTRSSLQEAWRTIIFERTMFTQHIASLIYDCVIEEAFALGILKEPPGAPGFYEARQAYTRCSWTGPGMGWVDPLKEIDATKGRIGSVMSGPSMEASNQGGDVFDNIRDQAMVRAYAEEMNVPIDLGGSPPVAPDQNANDGQPAGGSDQ